MRAVSSYPTNPGNILAATQSSGISQFTGSQAWNEGTVGGKRLTYAPSSGDMLSGTPGDQQQLWDFANSLPVE